MDQDFMTGVQGFPALEGKKKSLDPHHSFVKFKAYRISHLSFSKNEGYAISILYNDLKEAFRAHGHRVEQSHLFHDPGQQVL
jgi:hypothetical protein